MILSPAPLGKAVFAVGPESVLSRGAKSRTFSGKAVNEKSGHWGPQGSQEAWKDVDQKSEIHKEPEPLGNGRKNLALDVPVVSRFLLSLCHPRHCAPKSLHITI